IPLDVLGRTRATLTELTSFFPCLKGLGIPSKRVSLARVNYVPALCTHRLLLLLIK
ncbi:hypothetical protein P280DRAFT_409351, partial [Massarina eburnea CBS 473.64]